VAGKIIKGLLGAVLAVTIPAGASSFYKYETWWGYMLPACCSIVTRTVSGDAEGLIIPVDFLNEMEYEHAMYCYKLDGNGIKKREWLLESVNTLSCSIFCSNAVTYNGGMIVSYCTYSTVPPFGEYRYVLQRFGPPNWKIHETVFPSEKPRFGRVARPRNGNYYYCYRWHNNGLRVCKSPGTPEVISYFTPVVEYGCPMATDGRGHVYRCRLSNIWKYNEAGSVVASWKNPEIVEDLTVDPEGRLLVLSKNDYTYVYGENGSLMGSFTAPYLSEVYAADFGPGGKYYVMGAVYNNTVIMMYLFTPSPTNITPTSLGKIKAMYH
jgi:hypothetical protein